MDGLDLSEMNLEVPANKMAPNDVDALGQKLSQDMSLTGSCWEQVAYHLLNNPSEDIQMIRTQSDILKKPPGVVLLKHWSQHYPQQRTMMVLRSALERCNRDDIMEIFQDAVKNMTQVSFHVVVKYPDEIPDVTGRVHTLKGEANVNTTLRQILENSLEGELTDYEINFPKLAKWSTTACEIKGNMVKITRLVQHECAVKYVVDPVMDEVVSSSTDSPKKTNLPPNIVPNQNLFMDDLKGTSITDNRSFEDGLTTQIYGENCLPLKIDNLPGNSNIPDSPEVKMDFYTGCWPRPSCISEATEEDMSEPENYEDARSSSGVSPGVSWYNKGTEGDVSDRQDRQAAPHPAPVNIPTPSATKDEVSAVTLPLGRRVSSKSWANRAANHLADLQGWHNFLTEREVVDLLAPYLNRDGHYILWRRIEHGDQKLYISVCHGGDKLHYNIRARADDKHLCYYLFKNRHYSHTVESLIRHYQNHCIDTKVGAVTGAEQRVKLRRPIINRNV